MEITVDKEGMQAIQQLADIALKAGGLQSMNGITHILNNTKPNKEYKDEFEKEVVAKKEEGKNIK